MSPLWEARTGGAAGVLATVLTIGLLAGCGESSSTASVSSVKTVTSDAAPAGVSKQAAPSAGAHSSARTEHSSSAAHSTSSTTTDTGSPTAAATVQAPPSPPPSGRLLRRYTGSGSGRLGTIVVGVPSVLIWHAQKGAVQIFTSRGFLLVDSKTSNGSVRLSRGTYQGVRVASRAGWSIELRTRAS